MRLILNSLLSASVGACDGVLCVHRPMSTIQLHVPSISRNSSVHDGVYVCLAVMSKLIRMSCDMTKEFQFPVLQHNLNEGVSELNVALALFPTRLCVCLSKKCPCFVILSIHLLFTCSGGWLLVTNILGTYETGSIQQSWAPASSYDEINNYNYGQNVGITASVLGRLRLHLNFTQLRFHCSKQHGRTFHVITATNSKGEAVVQYFSGQTDTLPGSCDSFRRMNDDTSVLALNCALWGNDGRQYVGKWGHHDKKDATFRLYDHAAFIASRYHWHIVGDYWLCDDEINLFTKSARDFWKIFVR